MQINDTDNIKIIINKSVRLTILYRIYRLQKDFPLLLQNHSLIMSMTLR